MELNDDPSSDELRNGREGLRALSYGCAVLALKLVKGMTAIGETETVTVQYPQGSATVTIKPSEAKIELHRHGVTLTMTPTAALDDD